MREKPKLVLVEGCGMNLSPRGRARSRLAAKNRPVNVGPHLLAGDRPLALALHVDDDGFANVLPGGDGFSQIPKGGPAISSELLLLSDGEAVQVGSDAFHRTCTLPTGNVLSSPAGHLPSGRGRQNRRMQEKDPKQEVRHRQLLKARKAFKGNDREFAEKIGVSPNYFSRLKSWPSEGSKAIGDACREWEVKLGYPLAWFDRDDNAPPAPPELTPEALRFAEIYDDLDRAGRLSVQKHIRELLQGKAATRKAS